MILAAGSFFFSGDTTMTQISHFGITFHKHSVLIPNDLRILLFRVKYDNSEKENNLMKSEVREADRLNPLAGWPLP